MLQIPERVDYFWERTRTLTKKRVRISGRPTLTRRKIVKVNE